MKTILIIEDEIPISQVLKVYLQKANFKTVQAFEGNEAIEKFKEHKPALVLLDVMLPEKDGWAILKEIRQQSDCPIIMLTALGDVNYRLTGLNDGADDYISKPFIAEEVVARVNAVLRRSQTNDGPVKSFGQLQIDLKSHRVTINEEEVELTPRDLSLLLFLAENPNQTFTRDQLIEHVWGWEYDGSDRAVDLAIKRLRKSLYKWPESDGEIKTLRGLGYQFCVNKKQ
ncbi:response regulator transcription factor [Cytobacillus solani]|uniref:Transcriptional regulator n=1 Tax=Cytobacillus solani TaxID=1637975 RepID=A0A0Q3QK07_9BACI|nr:response regulator transcription factor [Cytobacillus solani]KOP71167.1 transcriptional regulator [Bacillus sp. FJAT-21945]KQL17888.1 transcriptional regulator [Cytobacillus solani]USK55709.1 response regulator transcription factor [Cytobacillus solani]